MATRVKRRALAEGYVDAQLLQEQKDHQLLRGTELRTHLVKMYCTKGLSAKDRTRYGTHILIA